MITEGVTLHPKLYLEHRDNPLGQAYCQGEIWNQFRVRKFLKLTVKGF